MIDQTSVDIIYATTEAWDTMLKECENAKISIYYEQYILTNDKIGRKFLELFLKKAKEGVTIHCVFDFSGSHSIYNSNIIESIREHGGIVNFYRPLSYIEALNPSNWFPRTHMKCMVIDQKLAFIGSACVGDHMSDWRDTTLKLSGPLLENIKDILEIEQLDDEPEESDLIKFHIHFPDAKENKIYTELLEKVRYSKKEIIISTPYLIPPEDFSRALIDAKNRGVDVTILTSLKSDSNIADYASEKKYHMHLEAGIKIWLYQPSVLHAKYVLIDGEWATVGSSNIDNLSLRQNRESNITIKNEKFVTIMKNQFMTDLEQAFLIDKDYVIRQPLYRKILCYFFIQFKNYL